MSNNARKTTVKLEVADATRQFIDREVADGAAGSREEYIAMLIEEAAVRAEKKRLAEAIREAKQSPAEEVTAETFAKDREEFERQLAEQMGK